MTGCQLVGALGVSPRARFVPEGTGTQRLGVAPPGTICPTQSWCADRRAARKGPADPSFKAAGTTAAGRVTLFQELAVISFRHAPRYRWRQVDYRPELSADPGPRARCASARGQGLSGYPALRRPPATGHRPPATGHRPPATGHRPPLWVSCMSLLLRCASSVTRRELLVCRLPQVEKRRAGPTEGDLGLLVRRPHEQVRDGRLKRPG